MRAVIVGCGRIAGGYNDQSEAEVLTHVVAWRALGVDVAGCCDVDGRTARSFARRWNIQQSGTDLEAILRETQPDLVSICTPPSTQVTLIRCITAVASVRGVLVEKPLGASLAEATVVAGLLRAWSRPAIVNYYRAFDPAYQRIARDGRDGQMGALRSVVATYYGAARTNASHLLERVLAASGSVGSPVRVGGGGDAPAFVLPLAENGRAIFVPVGDTAYAPLELDFLFERGRYRVIDSEQRAELFTSVADPVFPGFQTLSGGPVSPAPTFRAFRYPFGALAHAASGAPLDIDTITPAVEVTRVNRKSVV